MDIRKRLSGAGTVEVMESPFLEVYKDIQMWHLGTRLVVSMAVLG